MINNVAFTSQTGDGVLFFSKFIPALVGLTLVIGIVFFFFMLVTGAIAWTSSSGDKSSIETARGRVSNAIIGIVILLSLYAIVRLTGNFFHINLTNININSLFAPAGGGAGGGTGGGSGTGVAACVCANGGCAQIGTVALGNQVGGRTCNQCTATGWQVIPGTSCSGDNPIVCGACP